MKIAVCIKRVPDMDVRFKIAASGKSVDESGLKFDISDFDGYAVEAALQIKEKANTGEVVVISLGPDIARSPAQSDEHGRRSRGAAQARCTCL